MSREIGSSRTKNASRNIAYSLIAQAYILLSNFIIRTVFIKTLGQQYLGISGLFTNIITILSLTELGFGNAITYALYSPIAKKDTKKIAKILSFYKKIYRYVFFIVAGAGVLLVPFLRFIIKIDELDLDYYEIVKYYLLFLGNTLTSYVFAYKSSLIAADQRLYVLKKYNLVSYSALVILQVVSLAVFCNYEFYLISQIICTLLYNVLTSRAAQKLYPYIGSETELEKEERKKIAKNTGSIILYKIATVIVENTDNILISTLVSTIAVGLYSNYYIIISALLSVSTMIFCSLTAGIGNLNTEKDSRKKLKVFNEVILLNSLLMTVSSVCLYACLDKFIVIWAGSDYVLDSVVTLAIISNYYIYGTLNPVCAYRDATGIFRQAKNISLVMALTNIALSIILGKVWGIFGILIATTISKLLTNYWYQPYILYRDIFNVKPKGYYLTQTKNIGFVAVMMLLITPLKNIIAGDTIVDCVALGEIGRAHV